MSHQAEWIHVVVSACVWAVVLACLLISLTVKHLSRRHAWIWFVGSVACAGLSLAMVQAFGWQIFHGWFLQGFTVSLAGVCIFTPLYLRRPRLPHGHQGQEDYDGTPGLPTNDKAVFLRRIFDNAVNQTGYQKVRNQKRASFIKLAAMLFASAATVLLGLKDVGSEQTFKNLANSREISDFLRHWGNRYGYGDVIASV